MSIETLAFIALALLVVIIFLMVYVRDIEVNKKLAIFERSIEELNYQNHVLNKAFNDIAKQESFDAKGFERKMIELNKNDIQQSIVPIITALQDIESIIESFKEEQSARIDRLESRTKEMSNLSSSGTSSSNEKMIIAQYSRGRSEAEIAKDLRVGIGEVDLVLKLANLK